MSLRHGAVGWSAVCDCGIFWSYSLTFRTIYLVYEQVEITVNMI